MSAHKEVGGRGGRWARCYSSKWPVKSRDEIISYLYAAKTTQKHLTNCMSPCTCLLLILMKPGPSQGQIPPCSIISKSLLL